MSKPTKITEKDDFVGRLKRVINSESVRGFAHKCGISEGALRNYLSGGEPTRPALIAISATTGVSLLWLAAGQGQMWDPSGVQSSDTENKAKSQAEVKFALSISEQRGGMNRELSTLVRQLLSEREQLEKQIDLLISENKDLRFLQAKRDDND